MQETEQKLLLLVDDMPENLDVLSGILRDRYKVKVAINGERALKIAHGDPRPDLILLDVMMPEMDGFEVCRQLKADPATAEIPVIFVTAKTEPVDEKRGFELGAVDYIAKPVNPDIVMVRVHTQLELASKQRENQLLLQENREILDKTLVGSIRAISHLLSWANPPAYMRTVRLRAFMEGMVDELKIRGGWQLNLAATLSQIGCAALPPEEITHYTIGRGVSMKNLNLFKGHPKLGSQALSQVPRLQTVARIVENQFEPIPTKDQYPQDIKKRSLYILGRQILKLLLDFDHALLGKKSNRAIHDIMDEGFHDPLLLEALDRVLSKMEWISCALDPKRIMPGMVLEEAVTLPDQKKTTLARGATLTQDDVAKLMYGFTQAKEFRLVRVKVPFKLDAQGNLPNLLALYEDTCPIDKQTAPPAQPVNLELITPILKELHGLCKEDDLQAREIAVQLQELTTGTELVDAVARIQETVDSYDFPEAAKLVKEMAAPFNITL
uniref:Putative response regulator receiver protein n=1 Tax=Magnetococcus massalia (strain MO-1) TaxID=451514 RepID=A0A1S7LIB6_MAGMO|nr:putative response regulator receiver protein [Candidatus Magnetococcus massalia]